MIKRVSILATLLILLVMPARAAIDQMILGAAEIAAGAPDAGEPPSKNESELFAAGLKGHQPGERSVVASKRRGVAGTSLGDSGPSAEASTPVPEPTTGLLLGLGLLGLARRIRRQAAQA